MARPVAPELAGLTLRERRSVYNKRYLLGHLEKRREYNKQYAKSHREQKRKTDAKHRENNRLNHNIKTKVSRSLHGTKGNRHWEDLVGYTVAELKKHLERLFTPEMNWDNYGTYWHIDHKAPVAVFNFDHPNDIDFRLCWSLENLQPLESKANRVKNRFISEPFQPSLRIAM